MITATLTPEAPTAYVAVSFSGGSVRMNVYLPGVPCDDCRRADFGDPVFHAAPPCSRAEWHASADVSNWGPESELFAVCATNVDEARATVRSIIDARPAPDSKARAAAGAQD